MNDEIEKRIPAKRYTETDLSSMLYGRVQPQARDLEEVVLGAMMLEKEGAVIASNILMPNCFYVEAHQYVFEAIIKLLLQSQPIDILTVTEELRRNGNIEKVGGAYTVAMLTERVGSAANIEYHCRIIFQKFVQRELIRISSLLIRDCYEDTCDPLDMLSNAIRTLQSVLNQISTGKSEDWKSLVKDALEAITKAEQSTTHIIGQSTGFTPVDKILNGLQGGDFRIIAARPSVGKTARMVAEIKNLALIYSVPVGVFSLEMTSFQLIVNMVAEQMKMNSNIIRSGKMKDQWLQFIESMNKLGNMPIQLSTATDINIDQIKAKARYWIEEKGVKALYIDYLQLCSGSVSKSYQTRDQEIGTITKGLKSIAKEYNIPVTALCQLSRPEKGTKNHKLSLADLRESGNIEQDADIVEFLERPDYNDPDPHDQYGNSLLGLIKETVAKNRNGSLGIVYMHYERRYNHFYDLTLDEIVRLRGGSTELHPPQPAESKPAPLTINQLKFDEEDAPF